MSKSPILFQDQQPIEQLEKRKGGYFHVVVPAETVASFPRQRQTRLICTLNKLVRFQCGLNHLGDGNFYIIIGGKHLRSLSLSVGDPVQFSVEEDPDPMGVPMPEVLEALLEQDESLKQMFDGFSDGKKRHVMHAVHRLKDVDKQVQKSIELIKLHSAPKKSSKARRSH